LPSQIVQIRGMLLRQCPLILLVILNAEITVSTSSFSVATFILIGHRNFDSPNLDLSVTTSEFMVIHAINGRCLRFEDILRPWVVATGALVEIQGT
jgi:hypothetical protein